MANIKSQKKRVLITREENKTNTSKRTKVKNAIKKFEAAINGGNIAEAERLLPITSGIIDAAKSDGIFHQNTASRKKARIAKLLDKAKSAV